MDVYFVLLCYLFVMKLLKCNVISWYKEYMYIKYIGKYFINKYKMWYLKLKGVNKV